MRPRARDPGAGRLSRRPYRSIALARARGWRALLVAAAALAPACTGPDAPGAAATRPIVDGTPDTGDPAVVAIGARRVGCDERLVARCSGALVAPRLVLTAAHCVLDPRLSSTLEVLFGSAVDAPDARARRVVHVAVHPEYREDGDAADLAALILDQDAPVAPMALDSRGIDGALAGAAVRVVGFGQARSTDLVTGVKRTGTATVTAVDDTSFRIESGPAMTCHGDSGGPVLAERAGAEEIIGVTSRGDPGCSEYGTNVRVDRFRAGFVDPWIDQSATWPGPRGSGEAPDAAPLCTASCADDGDCPLGLACRPGPGPDGIVNRCALPGLVAGTLGATCASDGECSDHCARVLAGDEPDACRCYRACADSPEQEPAPGSGCRAAPGASTSQSGTWSLLLALWMLTLVCNVMRGHK